MSLVMLVGLKKPIIRVGRMAGQYAKPRSADYETRDGKSLPSYRGDLINRNPFTESDRAPDPDLMLRAYERAALTLNFVRSLMDGGFADLHHPENWDLDFVRETETAQEYHALVASLSDSLEIFEAIAGEPMHRTHRVEFYASHEGLHLPYEQAQTRYLPRRQRWYNLTTHYPWIGMRTADLAGAHVEYFRGIANPVAIKIGTGVSDSHLQGLIEVLNPDNEPGRLTLIARFGADKVEKHLPDLIRAVKREGKVVVWSCDPMHGNTIKSTSGYKTRPFEAVLGEVRRFMGVHQAEGTHAGGIHVEMTGKDVTECTGGLRALRDEDLNDRYHTFCDPRLNAAQALELSFLVAEEIKKEMASRPKPLDDDMVEAAE
jgi:3-deoxy-7-phosphoheptulonate synthase